MSDTKIQESNQAQAPTGDLAERVEALERLVRESKPRVAELEANLAGLANRVADLDPGANPMPFPMGPQPDGADFMSVAGNGVSVMSSKQLIAALRRQMRDDAGRFAIACYEELKRRLEQSLDPTTSGSRGDTHAVPGLEGRGIIAPPERLHPEVKRLLINAMLAVAKNETDPQVRPEILADMAAHGLERYLELGGRECHEILTYAISYAIAVTRKNLTQADDQRVAAAAKGGA